MRSACANRAWQRSYEEPGGQAHRVASEDVNAYLREVSGEEYSAKDFRTWAGSVLAAVALQQFADAKPVKTNITTAVKAVAQVLGNTPTVCRKCYIHPEIFAAYLAGITISMRSRRRSGIHSKLKPQEAAVLILLSERLKGRRS
jgi:DNA topoisomerase-1